MSFGGFIPMVERDRPFLLVTEVLRELPRENIPELGWKNILLPSGRAAEKNYPFAFEIFSLRKAGLAGCKQLIVGSAPSSRKLLAEFQELGIEVHNAYGLTEAPLVTLNRFGCNDPSTVGGPLPETKIKIGDDGNIFETRPQVAKEYFGNKQSEILKNDWLDTGDFGCLRDDGKLVLNGRQNDVIITSYGKNVHPMKIESSLSGISGVKRAILLGDNKPYIAALLLVEEGEKNFAKIDTEILDINRNLSHPEKIKRWAILTNDLSPETGELTANFKVKKEVVLKRFSDAVNFLYSNSTSPASVRHTGEEIKGGSGRG